MEDVPILIAFSSQCADRAIGATTPIVISS